MVEGCGVEQLELLAGEERTLHGERGYCLVLVTRGRCRLAWKESDQPLAAGKLVLLGRRERGRFFCPPGGSGVRLVVIRLTPQGLRALSGEGTDLERGFRQVPFDCLVLDTPSANFMLLQNLVQKLLTTEWETIDYGADLFEASIQTMVVVLILRIGISHDRNFRAGGRKQFLIDDVFGYLRRHLTEEITLERLEKAFFISRYHLAREFKRQTGETIHGYLTKARLEVACRQLLAGHSVVEAARMSGFGDYNNFFRLFKKHYGVTPKAYVRRERS